MSFLSAFLVSFCTVGLFCTQFYNLFVSRICLCFFLSVCLFYCSTCLLPEMVNKVEYILLCLISETLHYFTWPRHSSHRFSTRFFVLFVSRIAGEKVKKFSEWDWVGC